MEENIDTSFDALRLPADLPAYEPRQLTGNRRAGIRYKAYSTEDFERAMKAVKEEGMSLRKASMTYSVPKTTLAEKLGDSCPQLPPLQATRKKKVATRYTWTEADMEQAVAAVQSGDASASAAARQFGVPYSHLNSRTRGRAPKELKAELARLTLKQESLMVDWAHAQCELGFPPSKDQIYDLAQKVLAKGGAGGVEQQQKLGRQWVGHWLRRHPHITALAWAPKSNSEKKTTTQKTIIDGTFTTQMLEPVPVADDSFMHEAARLEDAHPSVIDEVDQDADGEEQVIDPAMDSLLIQT